MASFLIHQLLCETALSQSTCVRTPDDGGRRFRSTPGYFALEPRVLFDGAAAEFVESAIEHHVLADSAVSDQDVDPLLAALEAVPPVEVPPKPELVFIDDKVDDINKLIASLGNNLEVHIISSAADGVGQIAAVLEGRHDISAIHILSHGAAGELELGSSVLTSQSIATEHARDLATIGQALAQDADILVYGCDFAAGDRGAHAIAALAAATGADVAASDDITGAASLGGDWDLEAHSGAVTAGGLEAWNWFSTLASTVINSGGGVLANGSDGMAIHVIDNGQLQIAYVLNGTAAGSFQLYHPTTNTENPALFNGIYLAIGNQVTGSSHFADGSARNGVWGEGGQTITGAGTALNPYVVTTTLFSTTDGNVTYNPATDAQVVIKTSYTVPNAYFTETVTVTPPTGNTSIIKYYHAMDTFLSGGDNGPAFSLPQNLAQTNNTTGNPSVVGVRKDPGGPNDSFVAFAEVQGGREFDHWYSGFYSGGNLYGNGAGGGIQGGGNIVNTWDTNFFNDNGVAIQYTLGALNGPTTFSYNIAFGGEATLDLDLNDSSGSTGSGFNAYYPYGSNSTIPIVDSDVTIRNVVGDIQQVRATLSNGQTGDALTVNTAGLPAGIQVVSQTGNQIVLGAISTPQTEEQFQLALQTLGFTTSNTSLSSRNINFAVTNELGQEGLASAGTIVMNRAPTIVSDLGGPISFNDPSLHTGNVLSNDSDPDVTNTLQVYDVSNTSGQPVVVAAGGTTVIGNYGTLTIFQNGTYNYVLDTGNATVQNLGTAQSLTDTFLYTGIDVVVSGATTIPQGGSGTVQLDVRIAGPQPIGTPHLDLSGAAPITSAFLYGHNGTAFNASYTAVPGDAGDVRFSAVGPEVAGSGLVHSQDGSSGYVSGVSATTLAEALINNEFVSMSFTTQAGMPETWLQSTAKRIASGTFKYAVAISNDGFQTATLLSDNNLSNTGPVYDGNSSYVLAQAADYQLAAGSSYQMRVYFYDVAGGAASTVVWDDFYTIYSNDPSNTVTTFTEGGSPVAIAQATAELEDPNSPTMQSGSIVLTNKQTADGFLISNVAVGNGATGTVNGIAYTVTETAGTITIALSGSATQANYLAALQAITFRNTSVAPSAVDRIVNVTVNDGVLNSNLATATIHVVPVNNEPVAAVDTVMVPEGSNATGNVLTNDSDVEGDVLTITQFTVAGVGATAAGSTATIPGVGTLVIGTTGAFTFNPFSGFTGTPPAITYTISDGNGGTATAALNLAVLPGAAPIVDLNGPQFGGGGTLFNYNHNSLPADNVSNFSASVTNFAGVEAAGPGISISYPGTQAVISGVTASTYAAAATAGDYIQYSFTTAASMPTNPALYAFQMRDTTGSASYNFSLAISTDGFTSSTLLGKDFQGGSTTALNNFDTGDFALLPSTTYTVRAYLYNASGPNVVWDDFRALASSDPINTTAIFTENGPAVAISGASTEITDVDGGALQSAAIVLTNAKPGDVLAMGSIPFGISSAIDTSVSGQITITLTGASSLADYQTAIAGITFANTSDNPDTTLRNVTVQVSDGTHTSATAISSITVIPVNDAPTITGAPIPDVTAVDSSTPASIDVAALVTDLDADTLSYSATGFPVGITINATTGMISGTLPHDASQGGPNNDGIYPVTITISDGNGGIATTTVNYAITNPSPIANIDHGTVTEDTTLNVPAATGLLANDTDPDGDPLAVVDFTVPGLGTFVAGAVATIPNVGTLSIAADGGYTFTPATNYSGAIPVVTYTVSDSDGGTDTATLALSFDGQNDPPVIIDPENPGTPLNPIEAGDPANIIPDVAATDSGTPVSINVSDYVVDPDGDTLSYSASGLPNGLIIDPDSGTISGTLPHNASQGGPGDDGIYPVTITISDGNGGTATTTITYTITNPAPNAAVDLGTVIEDTTLIVPTADGLLANDVDPDSDPLVITDFTIPVLGTFAAGATAVIPTVGSLTIDADGGYQFVPLPNYVGPIPVVTYTVTDSEGGVDTATLSLAFDTVNDPPVIIDPSNPGTPLNPIEAGDPLNIIPDVSAIDSSTPLSIDISPYVVDPEGDPLAFHATGLPPGLSLNPVSGIISGSLPHDASQGGPDGDGVYPVTITISDGHGGTATTTITYTVSNVAPVATIDAVATDEDTAVHGNVLSNDVDLDGDRLHVIAVSGGTVGQPVRMAYGTMVLNADGTYSFTPNDRANALPVGKVVTQVVTYTVSDGNGGTDTATLTLTITGVNDAPVGVALPNRNNLEGDMITIDVRPNFSDVDGDALTYSATGLPPGLHIDPTTGVVSGKIEPSASVHGPYTVTISANDGHGGTVSTTFIFEVGVSSGGFEFSHGGPTPVIIPDNPYTLGKPVLGTTLGGIRDLNGTVIEGGSATLSRVLAGIAGRARHGVMGDGFDGHRGGHDNRPYAGDLVALRKLDGEDDMLVVRTILSDGALYIGLEKILLDAQSVSIAPVHGDSFPDNVAIIDGQHLIVSVVPGGRAIDLRVVGKTVDGETRIWILQVEPSSGKVSIVKSDLAETVGARKFTEQISSVWSRAETQQANLIKALSS